MDSLQWAVATYLDKGAGNLLKTENVVLTELNDPCPSLQPWR